MAVVEHRYRGQLRAESIGYRRLDRAHGKLSKEATDQGQIDIQSSHLPDLLQIRLSSRLVLMDDLTVR